MNNNGAGGGGGVRLCDPGQHSAHLSARRCFTHEVGVSPARTVSDGLFCATYATKQAPRQKEGSSGGACRVL